MSKSTRRSLPIRPDLLQLKKQARSLHRALRAGSSEAFARVAAQHPRIATAGHTSSAQCRLSDAQLTIAREHGFASWPALAAHIAAHASLPGPENASNPRARRWTEQLFEPLSLLARRVPWLSKPELVRLRQAGDWQGLLSLGEKLCPRMPHPQHTHDDVSPELARFAPLLRALSELARSGHPEPQGASAGTSSEQVSACLVVLYAAGYPQLLGQRVTLTRAITRLGRGEHNEIILHGAGISRCHARIEHENGVFVLVDAGSTNGTFVRHGAERVERHTLRDGDQLLLGDAILVFLSEGDLTPKNTVTLRWRTSTSDDALTAPG